MTPDFLVQTMTPQVYERLKDSVETGKWLDGNPLSPEQQEACMQAVIMYQAKHLNNKEHMTVSSEGEFIQLSRQELKQQHNSQPETSSTHQSNGPDGDMKQGNPEDSHQEIARFKQDDF